MNEITFIDKNQGRWKEFESLLNTQKETSPDKVSELFIMITDDLAYARTYFPNSKVSDYLNYLSVRVYHKIYKNKKVKSNRFSEFWLVEYPLLVFKFRKYLYYSLLIFIISFAIGALSSEQDSNFLRLILHDDYVNKTLENIRQGDPMAVYKQMNPTDMFLLITLNNIKAAMLTTLFGLLASIGTAFSLLYNGIMVGALQGFFIQKGLFWESFLSIYIHGTYELFAIIVAGGSGFIIGSSILFPGNYSRLVSFKNGVINALKVLIGIIPLFIVAGFLEGFITRLTESPDIVRFSIIIISFLSIVFYFFIYPKILINKLNHYGKA